MAEAEGRRQAVRVARIAGLALVMVLSACTVVPRRQARPVQPPPPPPVAALPEPVGSSLPSDAERHRIALLVPITGPNAGVGTSIANAANMAVLDTGGATIRITTYDTGPGAQAAARRAVLEGNRLILGPLLAEDVRAVAAVARPEGVPLIAFSNDTSVAGNGTFLMGYAPAQSVARVVSYARSKGMTRFAGLVPTGLYGQRSSTALIKAVEGSGGQVVSLQTFDRSRGSISAAITRMSSDSAYDAVLVADSGRTAVQAAPLIRARGGATAKILGTELWNTDGALAADPALRGAWFASVSDNLYNQLATKYRVRYGRGPYRLASLGYDSVLLVTRISTGWKVGTAFPAARLVDTGGFTGIDGPFRFGRDGVAERALEVQQAGPGGFSVADPAPRSF